MALADLLTVKGLALKVNDEPKSTWRGCQARLPRLRAAERKVEARSVASQPSTASGNTEDVILSLPGDAFSYAEKVATPEEFHGCSEEEELSLEGGEESEVEDADGEWNVEERIETDVDDLRDALETEEAQDVADGSESEQAEECVEPPVIDEELLMNATAPLLIVKRKRKKKKKKKRKKAKLPQPEVLEKKPAVPRFPHPAVVKLAEVPAPVAVEVKERPSLRERFSRHLLLGRFPRRKTKELVEAPEPEPVENEAAENADDEAVPPKVPRPRLRRRRKPRPEPEVEKAATEAPQKVQMPLVVKAMPRLRREAPSVKTVWKEPVVDTLLTLGSLYFSFSSMRTSEGHKVPLKNRDQVVRTLHELNSKVAVPICRHFGLRYNFFSEHHPQAKKAGVTVKEPLILRKQAPDGTELQERRHLVTIRLRLRLHPSKGDPQTQFVSRGTQIAVLLHELCHLRHMNHGKDFMLFLRDIFSFAAKLGVFSATEENEIPSPWPWENVIFQRAGDVSDDELLELFAEHREKQREGPDIEAMSTSASDEGVTIPGQCADGRCDASEGEHKEMAYGEETQRVVRLPPLVCQPKSPQAPSPKTPKLPPLL